MLCCLSTFHLIAFILWHLFNHTRQRRFWWHCGDVCDMVSILFFFPQQRSTRVSLQNNFFIQFYFLFLLSFYLPKKWRTLLTTGIAKCTKKWVFWSCKMLLQDQRKIHYIKKVRSYFGVIFVSPPRTKLLNPPHFWLECSPNSMTNTILWKNCVS